MARKSETKTKTKSVLVPVDQLPTRRGRTGRAVPVLDEFAASKLKLARIDRKIWDAKPGSILTSLRSAIAKGEYKGIKVVMRGGEIFLVRGK